MAQGNKNPSPATRFKVGQRANPQGKTSRQRELEIENAELATKIRARLLKAVHAVVEQATDEQALAQVEADVLRLLKDSEDRSLGAPQANVDLTTNGKDIPGAVDLSKLSDETLADLVAARDAAKRN